MKKWIKILLVILAVLIILMLAGAAFILVQNSRLKSCKLDSDCQTVSDGCCSCNNGGKNTAINKNMRSYWDLNKKLTCGGFACLMVISNDWTCLQSEPKCMNNKCQLVRNENKAGELAPNLAVFKKSP